MNYLFGFALQLLVVGCFCLNIGGGPVKRSVLNLNIAAGREYLFINALQDSNGWVSPNTPNWTVGAPIWSSGILDANGWPGHIANGVSFGGGFYTPDSSNFAGPWCFDSSDTTHLQQGTVTLAGSWTQAANTTCANGSCTGSGASISAGTVTINGTNWCIPLTFSGSGASTIQTFITTTDPNSNGAYVRNLRMYRQADAADLAAGKIFRTAVKQQLVSLNPGAIRAMNWNGASISTEVRFENRNVPSSAGYSGAFFCSSLPYGDISGTDQYSLPSVNAAGCSPAGSTPATSLHGEFVLARVLNSATTNCASGLCPVVTAITNAAEAVVTTGSAHGFSAGQQVILYIAGGNMPTLNLFPVTVQNDGNLTATTFGINFNSTSAGVFSAAGCGSSGAAGGCYATTYECLNVNSRGCFPIVVQANGLDTTNSFNINRMTAATYVPFVFDKRSSAKTDGAGNNVFGVWTVMQARQGISAQWGVPLEIQVALINEVNAMKPNGAAPTHLWVTMPYMGLLPQDPDYTTASDWPINAYNVILNGANGYPGLCSQCKVYIELSNESWNFAPAVAVTGYYEQQGCLRWGLCGSNQDVSNFSTLRSLWMVADIKNSIYYKSARTRFVLSGQAGTGIQYPNNIRIYGTSTINTDTQNPLYTGTVFTGTISGSTLTVSGLSGPLGVGYSITGPSTNAYCIITAVGTPGVSYTVSDLVVGNCGTPSGVTMHAAPAPMTAFDHFAVAPYIDVANAQTITDVTQGGLDYAGSCNTTPVQNDVQTYVNHAVADNTSGFAYYTTIMNTLATAMAQFGKTAINYEGGIDIDPDGYSGITNGKAFIICIYQSQAWATAQINYWNSVFVPNAHIELPSVLLRTNGPTWQWSNASPDTWGLVGGVPNEAGGLSPTWTAMSNYNQVSP